MHAIIYTKPNCPKCRLTDARLSMPHTTRLATDDDYTRFRAKGYQSMPVVQVYRGGTVVDEWSDLQVDSINRWNHA
ncbi:thioredoxin domain-containing protein [Lacticaseibacillus nasuensis]|uniref:ribonucleoside-diphosphate reductase n=1 Tax=Lacticaseibacillus nasuensis TaxID=944671 RepID=UPI002AFEC923|nr:ribonucleoside-diphosphate reductase [Lacticaseibacillus nasuensis]